MMNKQLIQDSIQQDGKEINEGIIMAEGTSVYTLKEKLR